MQLLRAFRRCRQIEEFSGKLTDVSVHQDGRVFIRAECPQGAFNWCVALSAAEARKLYEKLLSNRAAGPTTPRDAVENVTHGLVLQDAENPALVENHR